MKTLTFYLSAFSILYLMCVPFVFLAEVNIEIFKLFSTAYWVGVVLTYPIYLRFRKILQQA